MSPSPTQPQGPSSLVTRYALLGPLATSTSATRYAAIDRRLARPVTLTLFHREHAGAELEQRRLVEVAATLASIDHPHLMPLLEVGASREGQVFLVTPRGAGRTLRELRADGPTRWRPAVELARQLLTALAAMHASGLVHGALSADACLVSAIDGRDHLRLQDFGPLIHRRTHAPGHPQERAPTASDDLQAVGVLLEELLAGIRPVPRAMSLILECALARAPEGRFPSATAFAAALSEVLAASKRGARAVGCSAGCAAARGSLAAWTRFEYDLARTESRRASALDPAWLPLQLLMSFVPETDAGDPY